MTSGGHRLFYSKQEKSCEYRVGIVVSPRMANKVEKTTSVDERIMMIRLKRGNNDLLMILGTCQQANVRMKRWRSAIKNTEIDG